MQHPFCDLTYLNNSILREAQWFTHWWVFIANHHKPPRQMVLAQKEAVKLLSTQNEAYKSQHLLKPESEHSINQRKTIHPSLVFTTLNEGFMKLWIICIHHTTQATDPPWVGMTLYPTLPGGAAAQRGGWGPGLGSLKGIPAAGPPALRSTAANVVLKMLLGFRKHRETDKALKSQKRKRQKHRGKSVGSKRKVSRTWSMNNKQRKRTEGAREIMPISALGCRCLLPLPPSPTPW